MRVLAVFGIVLAPAAAPAVAGDFEDGVKFVESKDYARAISSFRKAAARGDAKAQNNLGVIYYKGEGVAQDYVERHKWRKLAGENGYADARKSRETVEKLMTREQIAEAQRRASEWMKAHK
jgi:TPR repeat protein